MNFKLNQLAAAFFVLSIVPNSNAQLDTNNIEINVFPNPNSGKFYITLVNEESYRAQLFSMDGRLVKTIYLTHGLNYVSVDAPEGMYILRTGNNEAVKTSKIEIK